MTSPSLFIRRIVVKGELSFDQIFDLGLNIIQAVPTEGDPKSTNSCGKTALVELIRHGLGRQQNSKDWHFQSISQQMQTLWLEIETNGKLLTIERSMQSLSAALRLREGLYTPKIQNVPSERISVDDMSSVLLNALGIPNVSVKMDNGNLTPLSFPLLMRAFILHQDDNFGAILDKVQPDKRRADIIGFLSGITPFQRFKIEDELSKIQLQTQPLEEYFQSVQKFLINKGIPSLSEAETQLLNAAQSLNIAREEQMNIQHRIRESVNNEASVLGIGRIESLRSKVLGIQEQISQLEQEFIALQQEYERLEEMYASLLSDRKKLQRLNVSSTLLGSIDFSICPRCMLSITSEMQQREQYARCCLCNRPLTTTSDTVPKATPRTEDIDLQIEETKSVLENVRQEKEAKLVSIEELRSLEVEASRTLEAETRAYISPSIDWLLAQAYEVAQRESELAHAKESFNQAMALDEIKKQLEDLKQKQASLEEQFREVCKLNRERLEIFRQIYESILRAVDFPGFRHCSINSQTLMPEINGHSYNSEGTALKGLAIVCYHLALLELARREQTYFPLMLVIDSPAVGDMNEVSYNNLLLYLASLQSDAEKIDKSSEIKQNWQIILTTRNVISELEPYVKVKISKAPNKMLLRRLI